MLLAICGSPHAAYAATFTVDSTSDAPDSSIDGVCATSNLVCTLRAAIEEANATLVETDRIEFALEPSTTITIRTANGALPPITSPLTIDGAVVGGKIEIREELSGVGFATLTGLRLLGSGNHIRNLIINGFRTGILIEGDDNTVIGCRFGGAPESFNETSIEIRGDRNLIGGALDTDSNLINGATPDPSPRTTAAIYISEGTRNIVRNNRFGSDAAGSMIVAGGQSGIVIDGVNSTDNVIGPDNVLVDWQIGVAIIRAASRNQVHGNFIGTDITGMTALPNVVGVRVDGIDNLIGGEGEIEANVISGNLSHGILITAERSEENRVLGNFIGTDRNGASAIPNLGAGVRIDNAVNSSIGGGGLFEGNVISGNALAGVVIIGPRAKGNIVRGNHIGTDRDGNADLGNGRDGILIDQSSDNAIGGIAPGQGNVISANGRHGIVVTGLGGSATEIVGNYIGISASGTAPLGNKRSGVAIAAGRNVIGTCTPGSGNAISGNHEHGVLITALAGTTTVANNRIGTNADGTAAIGNQRHGITVEGRRGNRIGSMCEDGQSGGNLISGNVQDGIRLQGGVATDLGNRIFGNQIGTDVSGTSSIANGGHGVAIEQPASFDVSLFTGAVIDDNLISGNDLFGVRLSGNNHRVTRNIIGLAVDLQNPLPNLGGGVACAGFEHRIGSSLYPDGDGNLISGNGGPGISLNGSLSSITPGARGITVAGNVIGAGPDLDTELGNAGDGVYLSLASSNRIGTSGDGNIIRFNGGAGVFEDSQAFQDNVIAFNSIDGNAGLGIDVAPPGVSSDPEPGFHKPPVLLAAMRFAANTIQVSGALDTTVGSAEVVSIDFYAGSICDPSGSGEGDTWVQSVDVVSEGTARTTFHLILQGQALSLPQRVLTATATRDAAGSTSEFSACLQVPDELSTPAPTSTPTPLQTLVASPTPTPTPPTTTATATPSATATSPAPTVCAGDCDGSGQVTVDELLIGTSIALGERSLGECPSFDSDADGSVTIVDLTVVINTILQGCGTR